jgi:hypothetical protein
MPSSHPTNRLLNTRENAKATRSAMPKYAKTSASSWIRFFNALKKSMIKYLYAQIELYDRIE